MKIKKQKWTTNFNDSTFIFVALSTQECYKEILTSLLHNADACDP